MKANRHEHNELRRFIEFVGLGGGVMFIELGELAEILRQQYVPESTIKQSRDYVAYQLS